MKSVARACARSTCSSPRTSRRTSMPSAWRSSSDREEGRLIGPLEVDVELVAVVGALRRRASPAPSSSRPASTGSAALACGLVGEVDARDDPVQQPAGEHRDGRRAAPARRRAGDRPGLTREDRPAALVVGARAPEAAEARRRTRPAGSACQLSTSASGTGSPSPSNTRPRSQIAPACPRARRAPVAARAARSRRTARRSATASSASSGPPPTGSRRPRAGRCRTGRPAPTRAASARGRSGRSCARAPSGRAPS